MSRKNVVFTVVTLDTTYETRIRPKMKGAMVVLEHANEPSGGYHGPDFEELEIPLSLIKRISK